jgi:hypothetical protein
MPYEFDPEFDFDPTPFKDAFGSESISFVLGQNLAADILVVMTVRFHFKEEGIYDLRFGIEEREISREGFSTGLDYSTEFRDAYVPKEARTVVLVLILQAIERLLRSTKAMKVTMRTF